jgi:hypothetical protein
VSPRPRARSRTVIVHFLDDHTLELVPVEIRPTAASDRASNERAKPADEVLGVAFRVAAPVPPRDRFVQRVTSFWTTITGDPLHLGAVASGRGNSIPRGRNG